MKCFFALAVNGLQIVPHVPKGNLTQGALDDEVGAENKNLPG